jgi:hypothetical protein
MKHIAEPSFEETAEEEGIYAYFQQNNARAHTAENSLHSLRSPFDEQIINTRSCHVSRLQWMQFLSLERTEAEKNCKNKQRSL